MFALATPVRIRGERWRITRRVPYDEVTLIDVAGADQSNRGSRAAFLLPFEPLERLAAVRGAPGGAPIQVAPHRPCCTG